MLHPKRYKQAYFVLGVDPATDGKDEAGFVILMKRWTGDTTIKTVYVNGIPQCDTTQLRDEIFKLHDMFNFDRIYIDKTGLGEGVVDMVAEYCGRVVEGIRFTQESKQHMFQNLRMLMLDHKLFYPATDKKLTRQLLSIKYDKKEYNKLKIYHDKKEHDDLVCAMALAALFFGYTDNQEYNEEDYEIY